MGSIKGVLHCLFKWLFKKRYERLIVQYMITSHMLKRPLSILTSKSSGVNYVPETSFKFPNVHWYGILICYLRLLFGIQISQQVLISHVKELCFHAHTEPMGDFIWTCKCLLALDCWHWHPALYMNTCILLFSNMCLLNHVLVENDVNF